MEFCSTLGLNVSVEVVWRWRGCGRGRSLARLYECFINILERRRERGSSGGSRHDDACSSSHRRTARRGSIALDMFVSAGCAASFVGCGAVFDGLRSNQSINQ
ncbi:hypothetical protein MRB53_038169 [Persea americana]|nr:hypothetical protein MRB53_038169 [Persea americana]